MALAYWIRPDHALTFDYGQAAAEAEITAASTFCSAVGLTHEVIKIDCSALGLGVMRTGASSLPEYPVGIIPPTPEWWPFRNQLLITLAAARAISLEVSELYLGAVASDRQHRDGLPDFYELMDRLLAMQEGDLRLRVPALDFDSADLVKNSRIPLSLLAWSHSCHRSNLACGLCRGCIKHQRVLGDVFGQ